MSGPVQRGFCVLLVSAAAGFSVWKYGAGSSVDRSAFAVVAGGFANPPLFVEGQGSHAVPWTLRTFSGEAKADRRQAPVVVSLDDDVSGFFQSSPPGPIDFAVVLKNFNRLGAKKVTSAVVLAWENPDAVEYVALERSMAAFDSLVTTAPLSRGAVATPLPQEFRRASVEFGSLRGDGSALPVVNRIPLPGVVLGGEKALAGFSVLESEKPSKYLSLMARWEDRLVFSSALLAVAQRLDLPLSALEIHPGEYLRFGPGGPVVPIDGFGRLSVPLRSLPAFADIRAEEVIDGKEGLFPAEAAPPVILRDARTVAESGPRAFSSSLSAAVAVMSSSEGLAPSLAYPRLRVKWETGILGAVTVVLALLGVAGASKRHVGALALAGVFLAAQWIGFGMASVWLPGIPVLAAIASAVVVARLLGRGKSPALASPVDAPSPSAETLAPTPEPVPVVTEPEAAPPAAEEPAKAPAKKAPAKKEPAKKAPPKKSAKAPRPRKKGDGSGR
ncbi:MAG: hypothetical protein EOP88_05485 [Verrucomicrobiaceae bacterium]|nr:MAG: hypothetical protein EOP88_05485 [Verrucomicrobiaceae bacterium]